MGKLVAVFCLAACSYAQSQTPGIEGDWQGTLDVGVAKLRLGVHIHRNSNGELQSTLDSIDQGAHGIPVKATKFTAEKRHLDLDIPALQARYTGTLKADGSQIDGTFTQGTPFPLVLKRVDKIETLNRPQTPKPPFPYESIAVSYESNGATLAGTLTEPRTGGPFPAALLITGSGPQDRDETIMGHKPFWIIADYLARRGIAVLRVDDRGVGQSTGNSTMTSLDEDASDALAGVRYLKGRKEIDPVHIGLIGHSEGGLVAPLAASQSPDVGFAILLAGPGVTGEQVLYLQADLIMRQSGVPDAALAQNRKVQEFMFNVLRSEQANNDRDAVIAKLGQAWKSQMGGDPPKQLENEFSRITTPEMRSFLFYDPAEALRKMKAPVLAMNGSRDVQVPPRQNLAPIVAAATAGGNSDVTAIELPGLNHLFQRCHTCTVSEYSELEESFSPDALELIADWIARHARK